MRERSEMLSLITKNYTDEGDLLLERKENNNLSICAPVCIFGS